MNDHFKFTLLSRLAPAVLATAALTTHISLHASDAILPDDVWFKGNQQTFNSLYYVAAHQGGVWVKPNTARTGVEGNWQALDLPDQLAGDVLEIASDDEHILAINSDRKIYTMWNALGPVDKFKWQSEWGFPFWKGPGHTIPESYGKWDFSVVSPQMDEYYVDPAGNHISIGDNKVSHIIAVKPGGRNISYNDPWLPADWSYEICGPEDGLFPIHISSASGSTQFVMGTNGDMYTRKYDFDLSGHDDPISYSYEDQTGREQKENLPHELHVLLYATQLPTFPWLKQPKIEGRITDRISIHKIGKGVVNRVLRVEGWDQAGNSGYYQKEMTLSQSQDWVFHNSGELIQGNEMNNPFFDSSENALLTSEGVDFYMPQKTDFWSWLAGKYRSYSATIKDLDQYCSPSPITFEFKNGQQLTVTLHTLERIRILKRDRGFTDRTLRLHGTIELDESIFSNAGQLSKPARKFVNKHFAKKRLIDVSLAIKNDSVKVTSILNQIDWKFDLN